MADDLGGAQAADLAADRERQVMGQAIEKTAGIEIAGPRSVDHASNRRRRDQMLGVGCHDYAAGRAAGQCGYRDMAANRGGRRGEVVGFAERANLDFVGEQDVDMSGDEIEKLPAVAPDTEW